jgi:hypothetical protein
LNIPLSKSLVRLNATAPACPSDFHGPCAVCIATAGPCAVNGFTGRKGAVDEIKSQRREVRDFGHEMPALRPSPDVQPIWRMTASRIAADE